MQKPSRKIATRKLNVIGNMLGHRSVLTSEENLKRFTEDIHIAGTYEDITERQKQFNYLKHEKLKNAMMNAILSETTKLKTNNCDFQKITKI